MTPEQEALREKVIREFTGHIASTCCHRTGGVNNDPKCECRALADAAIAVVLKEAPEIKRLRAALTPFAKAWQSARQTPEVWRWLSLGQLGALAQSEVSGSHFQRAAAALGDPTPQPMEKVKG